MELELPDKHDSTKLSEYLISSDPNQVIHAINVVLEASHGHEENYTLGTGDSGRLLVGALVVCFERLIGWELHSNLDSENYKEQEDKDKQQEDEEEETKEESSYLNDNHEQMKQRITCLGKKRKRLEGPLQGRKQSNSNEAFINLDKKYEELIQHAWDWNSPDHEKINIHTLNHDDQPGVNKIPTTYDNYDHDTCEWTQSKLTKWHQFCHIKLSKHLSRSTTSPAPQTTHHLPHFGSTDVTCPMTEFQYKLMESIIMIVRNLSFVAANARHLSYSIGILRILGAGLHSLNSLLQFPSIAMPISSMTTTTTTTTSSNVLYHNHDSDTNAMNTSNSSTSKDSNACLHSIQALMNITAFIQVSGSKICADLLLLDENGDTASTNGRGATSSLNQTNEVYSRSNKFSTKSKYNRSATILQTKQPSPPLLSSLPLAYRLGMGGMHIVRRLDTLLKNADDLSSKIPSVLIRTLTWSHILTIISLLPHILTCILQDQHRSIVLNAMDLLNEIMDFPDNLVLFETANIPDKLLTRLVDLLYIPRLGPDSLEYCDPVFHTVSRVQSFRLGHGYDATIDFDLRDRAVELLDRITQLSPELKRRVGGGGGGSSSSNSSLQLSRRLIDYLTMILGTTVGRSDAPQLAGSVLANIAMVPENKKLGMVYGEARFLDLAARDANVANVVCNSLLN